MSAYKPRDKACAVCGSVFLATGALQAVCSPECAIAHNTTIDPESGCWVKKGPRKPGDSYSVITYKGVPEQAHRFAHRTMKGEIPEGMVVRHTCDNKPCVNGDHLILGTHQQNMDDMRERGRSRTGEKNVSAKLTAEQAVAIYNSSETANVLADRYGCHRTNVIAIKSGRSWSSVTGHGGKR